MASLIKRQKSLSRQVLSSGVHHWPVYSEHQASLDGRVRMGQVEIRVRTKPFKSECCPRIAVHADANELDQRVLYGQRKSLKSRPAIFPSTCGEAQQDNGTCGCISQRARGARTTCHAGIIDTALCTRTLLTKITLLPGTEGRKCCSPTQRSARLAELEPVITGIHSGDIAAVFHLT
nr:hypothetical protein CFP56_50962 [Quercus suber]